MKKRLVVGVSGASGAPLAVELLRALQANPDVETHLILTRGGEMTLRQEMGITAAELSLLADFTHENLNIGAAPASGSWKSLGMVVCPCSMKTVAGIVAGYSYAMTGYILAEHPELSASEAIAQSKAMMEGNRWRLFCLQFSFIGWDVLCALTLGIGNLALRPYRHAAEAAFYRKLYGGTVPEDEECSA